MNRKNKKERVSKRLITPANFQETCRICFNQGNLYDTETSTYDGCTIAEIFRSLINDKELHIVENYAHLLYPQFICSSCVQNLIFTKLFFNQCYKAPKTLFKVYTHLTLHQHNSIIITKPSFLYQKANTALMQKCKLKTISLKLTVELEKAFLRRRNEVDVLKKTVGSNESVENLFELLADEENPEIKRIAKKSNIDVEINRSNKKRKIDLRIESNANQLVSLSTAQFVKILPTAIVKVDKTKKRTVKNDEIRAEIDEQSLSKVYIKIIPKDLKEIKKPKPKIPKQKIRKSTRNKKIVSYNEQQKKPPTIDSANINTKPIPNSWWCNSSNGQIYNEKVPKNQQGLDPVPPDISTKNNFESIETSPVNNFNPIQHEDANKTPNDSTCQTINPTLKNTSHAEACAKQFDVKNEPIELVAKTDNTDEEETSGQQKVDTVQISRAIADINRDQKNIDLDHCYTNMNVYKNVRYILPRLNFKRTNDLLYPAPDVARKKDPVLAGNISKRMASILSGNVTERADENEVSFEAVVKIEPVVEDRFETGGQCHGYIKPEYVHVDEDFVFAEEQRFMRMIQEEDSLHNDHEMDLGDVDPLLQSDNFNVYH